MYRIVFCFFCFFALLPLEAKEPCPPKNCGFNAPYVIKTCYELFFEVDFLYWQALEENLSIGSTSNEILSPCYSFDPGVRVLGGTFFSWDNWSFQGELTHFFQNNKTTASSSGVRPYWASTTDTFSDTIARWKLYFDEVALSLGREYYVGKCTTSRVHVGLEGLWIRQDFQVKYIQDSQLLQSENELKSWAVGPRIGWDTKWFIVKNLLIFTEVSGAMVYSDFYKNDHEVFLNDSLTEKISSGGSWYLRPILNMNMGFGWGCYYKRCYINLKAGYSATVLWNQNLFFKNFQSMCSSNGDLYLHGLTLYFTFYF